MRLEQWLFALLARAGMELIVGISDMKVSDSPEDVIVTYSLGSCVGVTMYDPEACIGGMVHCLMPLSRDAREQANLNPYMYVDTGVAGLLRAVLDAGAFKKRLVVKVAGAAKMFQGEDRFRTHERNYMVVRKILWKNRLLIKAERCGGSEPRTMTLYMKDGLTTIRTRGSETVLK
jgi:chemotaxis protein CheD